ncbi:acyltransferase [Paracoccus sp. WLY502]|uniref:acyltransferase n=1 Tax=Paracoccus yibinensis TaxID=3068891 RepID=UPI0027965834|nr:acyltransferase [Paracoccus sp. WLY502]MDQ1902854.1 acyltransferase [Paracoccus sp. WLY502]
MKIKSFLKHYALQKGRYVRLWKKLGRPTTSDWTEFLKRHGGFYSFGENCFIAPETVFTDPGYTSIGNNVRIAGAWISGHDGSINMLNRAYGKKLDSVGPVIIKDDVFIGRGCTILPGVTIGPRVLVGAGSVISKSVEPNSVVAGNPLRFIRSLDDHVALMEQRTATYPWRDIIERRDGGFDPALEPELKRQRIKHFFG